MDSLIFTRLINTLPFHVKQGQFQGCIFSSKKSVTIRLSSDHTTLDWTPTPADQFEVGGAPYRGTEKLRALLGMGMVYHWSMYLGKYRLFREAPFFFKYVGSLWELLK